MNSSTMKLKRLLGNKNTVTLICAILALLVLLFGYNRAVNKATEPVRVPYATENIQPRTLITDAMIGEIQVPNAAITDMGQGNIILKKEDIVGKYSNVNTMIPQGSMFYKGSVVDKSSLPDASVYDVKEGETLAMLTVNMQTSYVNSIVPGGYIDIYIRTTDTSGKARVGKFIENIKVLAVKTSDGLNVFEDSDENRTPNYVLFAVPNDTFIYLSAASQLGLQIVPVPTNVATSDFQPDTSTITSTDLKEYIDNQSNKFTQDLTPGAIIDSNDGSNTQNNQTNENE